VVVVVVVIVVVVVAYDPTASVYVDEIGTAQGGKKMSMASPNCISATKKFRSGKY
jgi:hypothetical protein